jgi:hypothetical protein
LDGIANPHGVAAVSGTVLVADPDQRRVVAYHVARGIQRDVVTDAPFGPPVGGAKIPLASTPILADGDGFLIGCDGDGSVRRLAAI